MFRKGNPVYSPNQLDNALQNAVDRVSAVLEGPFSTTGLRILYYRQETFATADLLVRLFSCGNRMCSRTHWICDLFAHAGNCFSRGYRTSFCIPWHMHLSTLLSFSVQAPLPIHTNTYGACHKAPKIRYCSLDSSCIYIAQCEKQV